MLIPCPECNSQISAKAIACPICGYPMKPQARKYNKRKRNRLPNGFGQISKITSKNLARPYRAMVTIDKTVEGKPICALLKPTAYFKTYNEAYEALLEYNKNRGEYFGKITLRDAYKEWYEKQIPKRSQSWVYIMKSCFKYCEPIFDIEMPLITIKNIKTVLSSVSSYDTRKKLKEGISGVFRYAMDNEYIRRNIMAENKIDIDVDSHEVKHHISFTDEEMKILWSNPDEETKMILIQCYSGWRPGELISLKLSDINISQRIMKGGIKTEAGKNRIVPIHDCIYPFVCELYYKASRLGSEYLITSEYKQHPDRIHYLTYSRRFKSVMERLGLSNEHTPHDCRKQFITMAKRCNVDEYAIKRIVGHTISDLTEETYTDRSVEWLQSEMAKIRVGVEMVYE